MKFLIDNALSPLVAKGLKESGYDAIHVRDYGIQSAEDELIFDRAVMEDRIIVSADTDFGTILALRIQKKPSFILFRHGISHHPDIQIKLLLENLPKIQEDLEQGSIIVFDRERIRIRSLPILA
jgi:predicted nuclease of predicted toxin-antitoxin system